MTGLLMTSVRRVCRKLRRMRRGHRAEVTGIPGPGRGPVKKVADSLAIKYQRTLGVSRAAVETLVRDGVWNRGKADA